GEIPTGGISITYKTGGGADGNVEAGRIAVVDGSFQDIYGSHVQLSVTNPEPASGGTERQTIESARLLIPESLRALNRTVAREDFEIHARLVPGVARALMLTSNEDASIAENSGILYVVPQGGGAPTPALKNNVLRMVTETYPCTLTFQVNVQNPICKTINIEARVYLRQGYDPVSVREQIKTNLQEMFKITKDDGTPNEFVNWGYYSSGEIALSDVFNTIRDTAGVRKIGDKHGDLKLNSLPSDVDLKLHEFPILGPSITLINGDTGAII
ncbi:MAG: t4-like baseplate wedge, partial [bacterium]|nr:t4-like baseplate wedge [bacterium]